MKFTKSLLSILLAAIMVLGCTYSVAAQATDDLQQTGVPEYVTNSKTKAVWADAVTSQTADIDAVKWWYKEGSKDAYLFLPTAADLSNVVIYHNYSSLTIDSNSVASGTKMAFENNKSYNVKADNADYTLTILKSSAIGTVFLTTKTGSMDFVHENKENKDKGNILVIDKDGQVNYDGILSSIKGRGNTTWRNIDKKPYNIKIDKATSLFGMDKSKKWSLLANGQDHSLLRNKIMFDMSNDVGLDFSPNSAFADIYANGEYLGNYQVTEKVEAGKNNLVKFYDLEGETEKANGDVDLSTFKQVHVGGNGNANSYKYCEIPNNPADITGGYLLEFDNNAADKYQAEASGFVTSRNQCVVIKDPEYCTKEQVEYIRSYYQKAEDALYSSTGKNSDGKTYYDYVDKNDMARMYLIQEYSVDIDSGITSCFFYKDSEVAENRICDDSIIHAGPSWDFDVSLGNLENTKDNVSMMSTDKWFAKIATTYNWGRDNLTIFAKLCTKTDFWDTVKTVYNIDFAKASKTLAGESGSKIDRLTSIYDMEKLVADSAKMNFTRWDYTLKYKDDGGNSLVRQAGTTHESHLSYIENFITKRTQWLDKQLYDSSINPDNPYKLGDVNLDGKINIRDATAIQKHIIETKILTSKGLELADYNQDGRFNIRDATAIQKFILELPIS